MTRVVLDVHRGLSRLPCLPRRKAAAPSHRRRGARLCTLVRIRENKNQIEMRLVAVLAAAYDEATLGNQLVVAGAVYVEEVVRCAE